jgi:hypothetical protein
MVERRLDAAKVVRTLDLLHARMGERFPGAGIVEVCADLAATARTVSGRARRVARPFLGLRLLVLLVIAGAVGAQLWAVSQVDWRAFKLSTDFVALTQGTESAVNLLILAGASVWFLATVETRVKRERSLKDLHELRSFAHVVDMHQLTKDPTVVLSKAPRTVSSPTRQLTRFQLTRYLEYCAEMLALIGKLAALYAEHTRDPQVVAAVNDIETLATDLGRKIWQKITILSALEEDADAAG